MSKAGLPQTNCEILIVDDEEDIRDLIAGILKDEGYETRVAGDSEGALAAVRARRPQLVILDIWLQGSRLDGIQVLDQLKREHAELPVVMISGHGTIETAVGSIKKGAYDFIEKPFKADRLIHVAARALESARLKREVQELRLKAGDDGEMVGQSSAISQLRQLVEKIAPTGSRVLITGPAGSGKEVAARLIHGRSRRAGNAFVAINCATMDPARLESELFGVEGGEGPRKIGLFELAHNGTLYLDEVADMPLRPRARSCACSSTRPSPASAAPSASRSTRASSAAPPPICAWRSPTASSARTSITASTSCRCACLRSPSAATTFLCWWRIS